MTSDSLLSIIASSMEMAENNGYDTVGQTEFTAEAVRKIEQDISISTAKHIVSKLSDMSIR
jgi:hypothetical protein